MNESELVGKRRTRLIVFNRATCGRCRNTVASQHQSHVQECLCGYLTIEGGRDRLRRHTNDVEGITPYRDYFENSIITQTYSRRGLLVECYRAEIYIRCIGPTEAQTVAQPGDFVVYEAEGGATAWTPEEFFTHHQLQEDES